MDIQDINPWWKTGKIPEEFKKMERRELFNELSKYIGDRQIISIVGLRRVGKTVLLHHLIDLLLNTTEKENIFYYDFDLLEDAPIEKILERYSALSGVDLKKEKIFIFLDELQKHREWEKEIKILYDNYRNLKFFISGSSSLLIEKKTKESLAGRVYSFELKPLLFREYLKIKRVKYDEKRIELYKNELKEELNMYIKTGGFPELMFENDETKIKKYIKELILDRVAYIDIPAVFDVKEPELLIRLLSMISSKPGMIFDYDSVASDLKRDRKTISNYIFYLEKSFLIKKVYNFSKNLITSEKKLKKIYPSTTALAFLYNADSGSIIETLVQQNKEIKFFYKKQDKEIDFISNVPIEVKYQENITKQDLKSMKYFMKAFKFKEGLMVTKDIEQEEKISNTTIILIPLWKWLITDASNL
jgi:predicted AAA+ superfamily ATPase